MTSKAVSRPSVEGVLAVVEGPGEAPLPDPGPQALGDAADLGAVEELHQGGQAPVLRAQAVDRADALLHLAGGLRVPASPRSPPTSSRTRSCR